MHWTAIDFGNTEIRGKTLPQIICTDPDWFFWAVKESIFIGKGKLATESEELNYKSRHIKIPQEPGKAKLSALYFVHPFTHDFDHIVLSTQDYDKGVPFLIKDSIDLSVPFEINCYVKDKAITKSSCEEFFDNPDNFDLP
jgi:hypothetical protein